MSMTIKEMRALANNRPTPIVESFQDFILDEAYYGEKKAKPILDAMEDIVKLLKANPNAAVDELKEGKALNAAIKDVFGFKSVKVYWSNRPDFGRGPFTMFGARVLYSGNDNLAFGNNQDRLYDADHVLKLYVQMDNVLVTMLDMNARELTAVLLHEIGHNFDYSPASIFDMWFTLINAIFTGPQSILNYFVTNAIQEYGRDVLMALMNLDTYITRWIPPVGTIYRAVDKALFNITKFLNAMLSPLTLIAIIPANLIFSPFNYLKNYFVRKREVYSDSVAAAYGFGPELITGLDKMTSYMTESNTDLGVLEFFYDLSRFQQEAYSFAMGGHTSNQQRMINVIAKLKEDLNDPRVDKEMKKECAKKLEECEKVYKAMIGLSPEEKSNFTTKFRALVDSWHNGKNYMIVPHIGDAYVK